MDKQLWYASNLDDLEVVTTATEIYESVDSVGMLIYHKDDCVSGNEEGWYTHFENEDMFVLPSDDFFFTTSEALFDTIVAYNPRPGAGLNFFESALTGDKVKIGYIVEVDGEYRSLIVVFGEIDGKVNITEEW